ncbi:putative disease resistance protein At3g14460 [Mangifera indica]|uniref:putative disease resistance protein At3g14460 n=1 Tax=Mangifera indica TaxID=29780 RepID=UPI001CF98355|nr:putative disease resistance protein At3g14460 [Mangifera indica]XP_044462556.1 putative disease resistance protein At3g14460 [Mangifera indica]XP_044462557.1 putative disease resistance protein At3g14460 [Mangifera indica]
MHGLMKDLAQFVSGDYCFRLEDKVMDGYQNRIFDKARHSSYNRSRREMLRKFDAFYGVECLRTFLPLDPTGEIGASFLANQVPHILLPKLKYLRVLSFNACRITELPTSVGELKHLRYLDLSRSAIKTLPGSIGSLYNLQTLILVECYSLSKLPTEIGNLTSLRHLRISGSRLIEMPLQMCRLTNLQTLSHFVVGKDSGSGVGDLKDIHQLQGALLISGLQNVVGFTDAIGANLKDKKDLTQLTLQWSNNFEDSMKDRDEEEVFKTRQHHRDGKDLAMSSYKIPQFPSFRETLEAYRRESVELQLDRSSSLDDSRNEKIETDVLEMLQPHKNIEKLMIKDYAGTRFPSWIGSPLFDNLMFLQLSNCLKCQFLPPLGQLPSLKGLTIEGMRGIKMVGTEFYGDGCSFVLPFPSLETLKFENMSAWEEWSSSGLKGIDEFPQLQIIEIQNCPKLRIFQQHFPTLKKMTISGCEKLEALPSHQTTLNSSDQGRDFSCLLELSIWSCPNLMELPTCFPALVILQIDGCQKLRILPKLPSISELELTNCDGKVVQSVIGQSSLTYIRICQILNLRFLVEEIFQDLIALEELQISQLGQLTTLSNNIGLQSLLSLQLLEISGCPYLKELPDNLYRLTSLKVLRIWNCPSLVSLTGLPSTLLGLEIKTCGALQFLPEGMTHESCRNKTPFSLEYLFIEECASLVSLPRDELSGSLKGLEIQSCCNLESLPEEMICNGSLLEILKISGCHSVKSLPKATFQLPTTPSNIVMKLKELIISNCMNLELLPEGLHNLTLLDYLEISDCPLRQSFPKPGLPASKIRSIRISNCRSLRFLPNRMYSLQSLEELCINRCSSLVSFPEGGLPANLISLSILDCENLKPSSQWGLHKLTCLTEFSFGGCQELVSFPEGWLLPANLSFLHLEHLPNLKSLPKGLKNLQNLETLETWNCDSLRTVPEEEPTTVLLSLWDAFWDTDRIFVY